MGKKGKINSWGWFFGISPLSSGKTNALHFFWFVYIKDN
jgi:hypothetical protein